MTIRFLRLVNPSRLLSLALTAAVVGLFAGLCAATVAHTIGEPSIRQAIAIEAANAATHPEEEAGASHSHGDEAHVSRSDQSGIGLFGAYGLVGIAYGALAAVAAHALRRGRPNIGHRVLLVGIFLAGALTVAPWFKYPPNPPAVGDPDTITERQSLYVLVICIAVLVGVGVIMLSRELLRRGWPDQRRYAAIALAGVGPMALAYAIMPPPPDAISSSVPADLIWRFRVESLASNLTLWAVLTLGLAWIAAEAVRRQEALPFNESPVGEQPVLSPL
jgi:predicted cobalt transporter CbtA